MDKAFKSDGCSVVKDYDQRECCVRHDWLYYRGGTSRERREADRQFRECIRKTSRYRWLAFFRWFGVRFGGFGLFPAKNWRWGFGWKYPRTQAPDNDSSEFSIESQRENFEKALKEAQEHDRLEREKRNKR